MRDLIFVIKTDGTYQKVPLKKLRGQENYSDNFVVIANRLGIVKANIRLLGRTDKVITQFLIPTFEKAEDLIGNEPYFQDYADAKVWRIGVSKEALRDISQSYSGQIEVSFSFLTFVDDERALNNIGDLTTELPIEAEEGDYLVCKLSSYTKDDITWTYGQLAIYHNSEWIKGGKYRVEGNTTTHKMSVEPTLIGTLPEEDIEDEEGIRDALENLADEIDTRTKANASDIEDILDGTKYVERAWKDRNDNVIHTHYATKNELDSEIVKIVNGTTLVDKAKKDQLGNVIDETYLIKSIPSYNDTTNELSITTKTQSGSDIKQDITLPKASDTKDGLMSKEHKTKLTDLPTESELDSGTYQVGVSKKAINDIDGNAIKDTYIKVSEKGQPNGVAPLNAQGEIAKPYLPASAFDIEEHASLSEFPSSEFAETGKIYIALDTNLTYRWSGTQYVEISKSLALGETELTAYRGDKGKIAYDHSQEQGNPHATESKDIDYDNTESGLESEKVQSAIDELADKKAEITYVDSKVFTDASYVDDELGKKLDKTTFEAYEIDTSETIDKKADYDGYYATLHAGVSDQLASPIPQIDTQEYLFRTSGGIADIGNGIAKIQSLKGRTLVFNQMVKNGDFSEGTSDWTNYDSNLSIENSRLKAISTLESSNNYGIGQNINLIKGRQYFVKVGYFKQNIVGTFQPKITANVGGSSQTLIYFENTTNEQLDKKAIFDLAESDTQTLRVNAYNWDGGYFEIDDIMLIDLTLMYGAGNEPSTVAEFEKDFPNAYYDYTLPTIKNISIDTIKTVGFNLWNGEYAKVVKADDDNNGYQINGAYDKVYFNTTNELDGNETELTPSDNKVYPSENGYLFLTDTDETTCISIVWSGWRVDDSEEYWEEEKLIETTDLFPNGMNGIGEIYDEITDTHKIQRISNFDLGEAEWTKTDIDDTIFTETFANMLGDIAKLPINNNTVGLILTKEYATVMRNEFDYAPNLSIALESDGKIFIKDSELYAKTVGDIKEALEGVILLFASSTLSTPHDKRLQYVVDDFGTEEFILAQQSLQIPIKHKTSYLENLRDKLRRLPSVSEIGSLSDLQTESKVLVGAINEVKDTKQDKVVDTGWLEITISHTLEGYIKYRKIDNRIFWRVALQLPANENDWGGATYIYALPSGNSLSKSIRPIIPIPISLSTSISNTFGSSINHAAATLIIDSNSGIITIYANRSNEKGRYLSGEFSYFLD